MTGREDSDSDRIRVVGKTSPGLPSVVVWRWWCPWCERLGDDVSTDSSIIHDLARRHPFSCVFLDVYLGDEDWT